MNISCFDDLLAAARKQDQPQRLLFVFAQAELPDDCTPAERESFLAGHGGALVPMMCVDKTPEEIKSFSELVQESQQFDKPWSLVFVAAMSGADGKPPSSEATEKPLQQMVENIKAGQLSQMIPFDAQGHAVELN